MNKQATSKPPAHEPSFYSDKVYLKVRGLTECSACLSWYRVTGLARLFHSRRCNG